MLESLPIAAVYRHLRVYVRTPPHRDHADRGIVITQIAAS
jgi:hypothetical protein